MKECQKMLQEFRVNHGLENNYGDLVTNLIDELSEVRKAFNNNDIDNLIEELTDLCIYSENALAQIGIKSTCKPIITSVKSVNIVSCVVLECCADMILKPKESRLLKIIDVCASHIESLGYYFDLAMIETVKKINSRNGAMNEAGTKWQKDVNQNPETLYIPDYAKCKIGYLPY